MIRLVTLLAALAVLALAAASPAAAVTPKRGVYDCLAYNPSSGFLDYKSSLRLKAGGRYDHTFGRRGSRFVDKRSGRYRVRRSTIRWRGGPMDFKGSTAKVVAAATAGGNPHLALLLDGDNTGIACYVVRGVR